MTDRRFRLHLLTRPLLPKRPVAEFALNLDGGAAPG